MNDEQKEFFDLVRDISSRTIGLRLLILFLSLIGLLAFHMSSPGFVILVLLAHITGSSIIYIWGGWTATHQGHSLAYAAKLGLVVGLIVGVIITSSANLATGDSSDLNSFAFDVAFEIIGALVFTVIGAFIAAKVRYK